MKKKELHFVEFPHEEIFVNRICKVEHMVWSVLISKFHIYFIQSPIRNLSTKLNPHLRTHKFTIVFTFQNDSWAILFWRFWIIGTTVYIYKSSAINTYSRTGNCLKGRIVIITDPLPIFPVSEFLWLSDFDFIFTFLLILWLQNFYIFWEQTIYSQFIH